MWGQTRHGAKPAATLCPDGPENWVRISVACEQALGEDGRKKSASN